MACLLFLFSCESEQPEPQGSKINISKTTAEIVKADNAFGIDLFKRAVAGDPGADNIFISPTSVALALAMTYNGAAGQTKSDMENALRKSGFTAGEINASYKELTDALLSVDPRVLLEIANSIWYRDGFTVLDDFIEVNQSFYSAEVNSLDFSLPAAPDVINAWVAEKTHDKILTVVNEIPPEVMMYLINAIYFKGIWRSEFDEKETRDEIFRLPDGSEPEVPMMHQQDTFMYGNAGQFSLIELPYGQGNYSMVVLLPEYGSTPDAILAELTPEKWEEWLALMSEREVVLQLPKFRFEYSNLLNDELTGMGMGIAFTEMADFSGINGSGNLYISKVLHKSFVEVNEEGTEAAAVTAVEISLTSFPDPGQPVHFIVNRPFLFVIREKDTGALVFMGRVNNPLTTANNP